MLDFLLYNWYMVIIAVGFLIYMIYSFSDDRDRDYTREKIKYYTKDGKFVYVPKKLFRPNYSKEIKNRFKPGNLIENENVNTGYIEITEWLGFEKNDKGNCYKYKYKRYSNEKDVFNFIIEKVEQLNIQNITNNDILFLKQINENLENVTSDDKEKAIELLETIAEIIPGIGGLVKVILKYIRLYKI